jgi:hypothetical protein
MHVLKEEASCSFVYITNYAKEKLRGLIPRANYTDLRPPLVGEVSANFCG